MKKFLLAGTMLAFMAVAAEAQIIIDYTRRTRNSTLTVSYNSGYYGYYGYYGGFGGFGYGDYYGYGGYPAGGFYSGGAGGAFYSGYGMYSYGTMPGLYGGRPYRSPYSTPPVTDYAPMPGRGSPGVADRMNEFASAKEIEVGRARFKSGDYTGALDDFRSAVVADTSNPAAQAHFAVALAVAGDFKNADKALRSAADRAPFGKVDFSGLFANEKERAKVTAMLGKVSGDGALSAAYALAVMGDPAALKKLAEKDPAAKKLLP
jgi:tetratricopeptide (TPR) repeat protein